MSRPFMPFYDGDWMRDTAHLDDHQERAYFRIVMFYWARGSLPTNDKQLSLIARMTGREWARSRATIMEMFTENGWGQIPAMRSLGYYEPTSRPAIPGDVKSAVLDRDGSMCVYCGSKGGPFHFDHVLPWSRGGRHTVENLVLACAPCNLEKGARLPEEWLQ
jgi:hypothetical protein